VRISWRLRNQAGAVLMTGLIAVPVAGAPHPSARAQSSARAQPSAGAGLTISVSDGRTAADPGDQLTYVVTVRDGGTVGAPRLEVTQTLSPGLDFLSSSPHEVAAGGKVTWPAAIRAGGTQTFRLVARVARTPARQLQVAAVACASAPGGSRPIVCAAHLDRLAAAAPASAPRSARPAGVPALTYAGTALAVLAAAALAVLVRRRVRLHRRPG
jgi:uncharacterized repeat protein (TIGR01451 family)